MLGWNFKYIRFQNTDFFYNFMLLGLEEHTLKILFSLSRNKSFHIEYIDKVWIVIINQHSQAKVIYLDKNLSVFLLLSSIFISLPSLKLFLTLCPNHRVCLWYNKSCLILCDCFTFFYGWSANQRTINGNNQSWLLLIQTL